ncbi:hypothetical protein [Aeromonas dhakensis]|uniref:hypothetical protein n=1 Tax=Aeromonas dhakensis TaxID=196024 RepID=UPI00237834C8|nr:hypothetical protein [Aeromonas dhakensis]MDD9212810.1 hypothetical protein [Aeromonas dhakensis]
MSNTANINYGNFPQQGPLLGNRVLVVFHNDTDNAVQGVCVRNDADEAGNTIIQINDGHYVLASECQHISIVASSISPERDRRNRRFIAYDIFGNTQTRQRLLLPGATPEQRAQYVKATSRAMLISAMAALLFVGFTVLWPHR